MQSKNDPELDLIEDIASFTHDVNGFVNYAFAWGEGELAEYTGPRNWQKELNDDISNHLSNPKTRYMPFQAVRASGHGIGKSAEIAMIISWALSTCEDTKVVITANTEPQLRTKTWPEIMKWFRLSIVAHWFNITATSIYSSTKGNEKTWRADAVTWSDNNTEAFAGLHNKGKRIVVIMDEGSSISDKVYEVTQGALTDEKTEILWFIFGNPTLNTGFFKDCFTRFKHRWNHKQIDSRTVEGTNKELIDQWLKDHGEDSDFFKVRVRGMFPNRSVKQFISIEDIDKATKVKIRPEQVAWAPKIISVDPAWEGDDEFVIGLRQGLYFKILAVYDKNDDDVHMAKIIADFEDKENADAVFIDGGYGTGIKSVGASWNRDWKLVWFGSESSDEGCLNKRAQMWRDGRDWLKQGGSIEEKDTDLYNQLAAPQTVPRMDGKIQLESKKDMKARGEPSPGRADALMITFAYPVQKKNANNFGQKQNRMITEYDPFERN